jgi:hypothetical protein
VGEAALFYIVPKGFLIMFPKSFQVAAQSPVILFSVSQSLAQEVEASVSATFNNVVLCSVNEAGEALLFDSDHWAAVDSDYFGLEGKYVLEAFSTVVAGAGMEDVPEGVIGHCRYRVERDGVSKTFVTDAFPTSMTGTHAQLRFQVGQ